MNVYVLAKGEYYQWAYQIWGTSLTAYWYSDVPMPTKPGMYLVNNQNNPLIFHLVETNEDGVVAQTMYIQEMLLRKWC